VNSHYIDKLNKDFSSHWLSIKGYDERIPVSRQYLLKLKEII
ncbi:MAG: LytTR family transcriptional regulator DNA-binding domain-containing protein, partial [Bacteroidetes bacterium]|nr:LytTR family transcriptional regulator DNA-binding domain-containing protein [Bacteroidota bacterium]